MKHEQPIGLVPSPRGPDLYQGAQLCHNTHERHKPSWFFAGNPIHTLGLPFFIGWGEVWPGFG